MLGVSGGYGESGCYEKEKWNKELWSCLNRNCYAWEHCQEGFGGEKFWELLSQGEIET